MSLRTSSILTGVSAAVLLPLMLVASPLAAAAQETPVPAPATPATDAGDIATSDDSGAMERSNAEMKLVLEELGELRVQPFHELTVEEARTQPAANDAVAGVLRDEGRSTLPEPVAGTRDITIPGPGGDLRARVYFPAGEGPFPIIVYFHGGGWVVADLRNYDAGARALVNQAEAIVVSVDYRQGPEDRFPAFHDDALATYVYAVENGGGWNGDTTRVALAGESAGGNLAVATAMAARDGALQAPVGIVSVYPIAGVDMDTPSYIENQNAKPLGRADMMWFTEHALTDEAMTDPRIDIIGRADVSGLPPTVIINAEIDPLLSDGEMLAEKLEAAGVDVDQRTWDGVAHEFFGMGAVVPEALEAQAFAGEHLRRWFEATTE